MRTRAEGCPRKCWWVARLSRSQTHHLSRRQRKGKKKDTDKARLPRSIVPCIIDAIGLGTPAPGTESSMALTRVAGDQAMWSTPDAQMQKKMRAAVRAVIASPSVSSGRETLIPTSARFEEISWATITSPPAPEVCSYGLCCAFVAYLLCAHSHVECCL